MDCLEEDERYLFRQDVDFYGTCEPGVYNIESAAFRFTDNRVDENCFDNRCPNDTVSRFGDLDDEGFYAGFLSKDEFEKSIENEVLRAKRQNQDQSINALISENRRVIKSAAPNRAKLQRTDTLIRVRGLTYAEATKIRPLESEHNNYAESQFGDI